MNSAADQSETDDKHPHAAFAVMILSSGDESTYRAIESARKFGLPVHVGLTAGSLELRGRQDTRLHQVEWNEDFGDACRRLQAHVNADFILRLASDEILFSFPKLDLRSLTHDIYGIRIQDTEDQTPRAIRRFYRNTPSIRWHGRIHEQLSVCGTPTCTQWGFLPDVVIRHFGYEDAHTLQSKIARNFRLAQAGLKGVKPTYQEILTAARTESYAGRSDPLRWLECFKHPGALYLGPQCDLRYEAAEVLCSHGYTEPAQLLLARNPLIIRLHIAILTAQWRASRAVDTERLDFLTECLTNGYCDPYYSFPKVLLGADREAILAHVQQVADEWDGASQTNAPDGNATGHPFRQPRLTYGKKPAHDRERASASARTIALTESVRPETRRDACGRSEKRAAISVCMLSHGNQEETKRAVRSARRFGLPVHIGLTNGDLDLGESDRVWVHPVPWRQDFAAARNALLERTDSEFVLWLDSDETVFAFPDLDWRQMPGDVYGVFIQVYEDQTPSVLMRIHRNNPRLRWSGRSHDCIVTVGKLKLPDFHPPIGTVIRHDGYEDESRLREKFKRNMLIARPALESQCPDPSELYSLASWETVSGRFNPLTWLKCFKHVDAQRAGAYRKAHCLIAPAEMLCSCGYTLPAKRLLAKHPVILCLHLAILAAELRGLGVLDRERFEFVVSCLQSGYFSPFSHVPKKLLAGTDNECIAYIQQLADDWDQRPNTMIQKKVQVEIPDRRFRRIDTFVTDTFESDVLVMHPDTRDVFVLNPIAAVLWDALRWPHSVDDLVDLVMEAQPSEKVDTLQAHVANMVKDLLSKELIVAV